MGYLLNKYIKGDKRYFFANLLVELIFLIIFVTLVFNTVAVYNDAIYQCKSVCLCPIGFAPNITVNGSTTLNFSMFTYDNLSSMPKGLPNP